MKIEEKTLVKMIDHTLLKPNAPLSAFDKLCEEAVMYGFVALCVRPDVVEYVASNLKGTGVNVCSVVGFPWGIQTVKTKVAETQELIKKGATEIDFVINRGLFQGSGKGTYSPRWDLLANEMYAIVEASKKTGKKGIIVKAILETSELDVYQIEKACETAIKAGVHFVKTSTGSDKTKKATIKVVRQMYGLVNNYGVGVKASGGIKTWSDAEKMIKAGAARLGTSSGVKILEGYKKAQLS